MGSVARWSVKKTGGIRAPDSIMCLRTQIALVKISNSVGVKARDKKKTYRFNGIGARAGARALDIGPLA